MWTWVIGIGTAALATVIGGALVEYFQSRGVGRREAAVEAGRPVSIRAYLRGRTRPFPRLWSEGVVAVGAGVPVWTPKSRLTRRRITLPLSATVRQIRRARGLLEWMMTDYDCTVLTIGSEEVEFDMAIFSFDLVTALRALEMGSGGGWRISHEVDEEGDE